MAWKRKQKRKEAKQVEYEKLDHKVAALWTRVSSDQQEQNNCSLESQEKICREYAERNGITIKKHYGRTHERAKTMGILFNLIIEEVLHDNELNIILVSAYDRFSRTGPEASVLKQGLKKEGIYVVSATQPIDQDNASGEFMQDIFLLFSKFDNTIRKSKCVGGVRDCLLRGEWPFRAPFGYDHYKVEKTHHLKVNKKGETLKKAFYWKAYEGLSNPEICDRLKALGITMNRKRLSEIFLNPVYCGYISNTLLDEGVWIKGNFEPLVDEETFRIINGRSRAGYDQKEETDKFPLKRHVRCADCGGYLTGYSVKAKGKDYYKCNKIGCKHNQSVVKMHNKYIGLLDSYGVPKEFRPILKKVLTKLFDQSNKNRVETTNLLNKQKSEVENKIKTAKYRYGIGEISEDVYDVTMSTLEDKLSEIKVQLGSMSEDLSNQVKYIDKVIAMCCNLGSLWENGDFRLRQNLQSLVFPDGILYDKKMDGYRTEKENEVFDIFRKFSDTYKNNKGTAVDLLSPKVEITGLEPATFRLRT